MRRKFMKQSANITNKYLTIVALEDDLTVSLSTNACEYCVDGDGNWIALAAGTSTQSVNTGQTLSFRGNLVNSVDDGIGTFTISKSCNLMGNCMSILYGDETGNILPADAFQELFKYCTTIKNVSKDFLPATTLGSYCYYSMFYGCTSLTAAPELPATTIAVGCYRYMFLGCTSLTAAPELPATTLGNYCYLSMFKDCTSLTTAPELPATTLEKSCYGDMFRNCSKLNYIKMLATDISASGCLTDWVYDVASSGTFVKNAEMEDLYTGKSGIPYGWTVENA